MKKTLTSYLAWAFGIAWILQVTAVILLGRGYAMAYTVTLSVSMFAPMAAGLLSGAGLKGLGWKPRLRGNVRYLAAAWFLPAVLGALGAALFFVLFPASFDSGMSGIRQSLGQEGIAQMEASGMSMPVYAAVLTIASCLWAPWVNMLFAVGEEAGWRGVMNPMLKEKLGRVKGRLVSGVIWGIWHWPVIILAGYEYGSSYWGAPITGPLLFCVITIAMGTLLDWLYERSGSVWYPALCHGAINAFAGIPTLFLAPAYSNWLLLGPLMIGLIGGLPLIVTAAFLLLRRPDEKNKTSVAIQ